MIELGALLSILVHGLLLALILVLIYWIAGLICRALGAPPVVMVIVQCVLAVIVLIWLIGLLGGVTPRPLFRW